MRRWETRTTRRSITGFTTFTYNNKPIHGKFKREMLATATYKPEIWIGYAGNTFGTWPHSESGFKQILNYLTSTS